MSSHNAALHSGIVSNSQLAVHGLLVILLLFCSFSNTLPHHLHGGGRGRPFRTTRNQVQHLPPASQNEILPKAVKEKMKVKILLQLRIGQEKAPGAFTKNVNIAFEYFFLLLHLIVKKNVMTTGGNEQSLHFARIIKNLILFCLIINLQICRIFSDVKSRKNGKHKWPFQSLPPRFRKM